MGQNEYTYWAQTTRPELHDIMCGVNFGISANEQHFINKYAHSSVLDIGCGTGHRTFKTWFEKKINFHGIEKFPHLIEASRFRDKIIQADISDEDFKLKIGELIDCKFDIAFLFGGVINGIIDNNLQKITWSNLNFLLSSYCSYVLIDTLTHFSWYSTAENGQEKQLFQPGPTQYFFSKNEINKLNKENKLEIFEEKEESIKPFARTHFLLRKL
jgi:hypothetical protein